LILIRSCFIAPSVFRLSLHLFASFALCSCFHTSSASKMDADTDAELATTLSQPISNKDPNSRPDCFTSTFQECMFIVSVTMAVAMTSFLTGSITVMSSFAGRDLGMTNAEITWMNPCDVSYSRFSPPLLRQHSGSFRSQVHVHRLAILLLRLLPRRRLLTVWHDSRHTLWRPRYLFRFLCAPGSRHAWRHL